MTELENELKEIHSRINRLKKRIKKDLQEVVDLVKQANALIATYKTKSKGYFSRNLSKLMKCKVGQATAFVKSLRVMGTREKIDRVFLEEFNIIEKPNRKNLTRATISKPPILILGEHVGKIRHLKEKGLSETNRAIALNMLAQLQKELQDQ